MKMRLVFILFCVTFLFITCKNEDIIESTKPAYFLSEIRPEYFDNLNFESEEVVADISTFLQNFHDVFIELEAQYEQNEFTTEGDLEYMRLTGMYYSFYMLALTGNYLDDHITFEDINGDRTVGLFSKLPYTADNFAQLELEAMMDEAVRISYDAAHLNGFNDKTYGFHLAIKQVRGRLHNENRFNNPEVHAEVMDYVQTRLVNYEQIPVWNLLMAMVTITNYDDPLNTFDNPDMEKLLFHVNARIVPGSLEDLGGLFPEMLGPVYRFDLNLKKLEWLFRHNETLDEEQIDFLDQEILILETATNFILEERNEILEAWPYESTVYERIDKLAELKSLRSEIYPGMPFPNIELKNFISSPGFKKAYQCYSCHLESGL